MPEKYTVARLRIGRKRFEVLVDPKNALRFREGEPIDLRDVVPDFTIFEDVRKGKLASMEEVLDTFRKYLRKPDVTIEEIVKTIVLRGEVEIPLELKREIYEKVKKEIIERIHRYAINPKTGKPHPPKRIEAAMEEVGVKIDPKVPVPRQAVEIVKALSRVIPIAIPYVIIEIQAPPEEAHKVYAVLMRYERIKIIEDLRTARKNDGSLTAVVKIKKAELEILRREIARVSKKATIRIIEELNL